LLLSTRAISQIVEVGVKRVHHHDQLVSGRARLARVNDEGAVEPLVDVPLQRHSVAVIQVQTRRFGVELVHKRFAGEHLVLGKRAVHFRRMPSVKVNRVRMRPLIEEADAEAVAFGGANRRTRDLAVVSPRRELDARRDLDFAIHREYLVLAQQGPVLTRCFAIELCPLVWRQVVEIPGPGVDLRVEGDGRDTSDRA
jgi:hypothetical protein